MVTMPSEAATDRDLVRDLVRAGMSVMRVNTAHDGPDAWAGMVENLRRAARDERRDCRVLMDLQGPKARTGPVTPGPKVVSWNPAHDELGVPVRPALVLLHAPRDASARAPAPDAAIDAALPVTGDLARLRPGDELTFTDARGRSRTLRVDRRLGADAAAGILCSCDRAAYVQPGCTLSAPRTGAALTVADVPALPASLRLRTGDTLRLHADASAPGTPAVVDARGRLTHPAAIGFTIPAFIDDARPGDRVLLDDGKIECVVERASGPRPASARTAARPAELLLRVTHARPGGAKLRAEKGVNFPDARVRVPALTDDDRAVLPFVAQHADAVGFSFVNDAQDLDDLRDALLALPRPSRTGAHAAARAPSRTGARARPALPGVVLKIETRRAFDNLPALLLRALALPGPAGVMIARGDLAVELGWQRMAEVQEEILWLCEAAHLPVVWATQVLETLAKSGLPSRAEITDAAMSERAECVMLNKGPFVVGAVRTLDDILRRMQDHQSKKRALFRPLSIARNFMPPGVPARPRPARPRPARPWARTAQAGNAQAGTARRALPRSRRTSERPDAPRRPD
jgi:pyruvate kinase